jgi:flagellar basal-body rod protein FlgC
MAGIFSISASGMEAQRQRMNVIAGNIANADSTKSAEGGPYRRKDVVFATQYNMDFDGYFRASLEDYGASVKVSGVVNDARPLKYTYEPGHPEADANGYVAYPNVNVVEEVVNMISASRGYEANVTAFKATRDMALKALEIGQ